MDHRSLTEKDLRPPGSAEAPDREENSRADRIVKKKERSDEFPSVSETHLTAEVRKSLVNYCEI